MWQVFACAWSPTGSLLASGWVYGLEFSLLFSGIITIYALFCGLDLLSYLCLANHITFTNGHYVLGGRLVRSLINSTSIVLVLLGLAIFLGWKQYYVTVILGSQFTWKGDNPFFPFILQGCFVFPLLLICITGKL